MLSLKEVRVMCEIRNIDGRLVCFVDEATGTVEIKIKNCTTLIKRNPDGTTKIENTKTPTT